MAKRYAKYPYGDLASEIVDHLEPLPTCAKGHEEAYCQAVGKVIEHLKLEKTASGVSYAQELVEISFTACPPKKPRKKKPQRRFRSPDGIEPYAPLDWSDLENMGERIREAEQKIEQHDAQVASHIDNLHKYAQLKKSTEAREAAAARDAMVDEEPELDTTTTANPNAQANAEPESKANEGGEPRDTDTPEEPAVEEAGVTPEESLTDATADGNQDGGKGAGDVTARAEEEPPAPFGSGTSDTANGDVHPSVADAAQVRIKPWAPEHDHLMGEMPLSPGEAPDEYIRLWHRKTYRQPLFSDACWVRVKKAVDREHTDRRDFEEEITRQGGGDEGRRRAYAICKRRGNTQACFFE